MESAIDAGHLHASIEAVQAERDAWRADGRVLSRGPPLVPMPHSPSELWPEEAAYVNGSP